MVDVGKTEVKKFFTSSTVNKSTLAAVLKQQRFSWNPDRMCWEEAQLDKNVLSKIAEVYQIVISLWKKLEAASLEEKERQDRKREQEAKELKKKEI